ncbi:MAG: D-alanine--D-alanine ligase, partial [Pseudomonadota bacterium]
MKRLNVAVLFGGPSQEHDVSVISAQQLMDAADVRRLKIIPVYMAFDGRFFCGPALRALERFRPNPPLSFEVRFAWGDSGPAVRAVDRDWVEPIDCALPVFHGPMGEDGRIQGLLEVLGVPTAGFSASGSALAMRKDATKALARVEGVNVLPHVVVQRAELRDLPAVCARVEAEIAYPAIVKPANLGSSIGVGRARDRSELMVFLQNALVEDRVALVEPQVQNLEELNLAVLYADGAVRFSAIERPKSSAELLDFREKYLSGGAARPAGEGGKLGAAQAPSQGMLSLTRTINPELPAGVAETLRSYAARVFATLGLRGAPRLDFMRDTETGEIWFNEINPIPGSYGFFLWEAAETPLMFPQLIDHLVAEALAG